MKKTALVFCFLITGLLASGISLSKVASIPTCPYNQHSYMDTVNLPLLLQQALTQQFQQIYQPANNFNPYSQLHTIQNKMKPSHQQQNIAKTNQPKPNHFSQFYMDKVIAHPIVQDILNPNVKLKDPVIVESSVKASNDLAGNIPQVVNNYFIVPTEYIKNKDDLKTSNSNGNKRGNPRKTDESNGNGSFKEYSEQNRQGCRSRINNDTPVSNRKYGRRKRKRLQNKKQLDKENVIRIDTFQNVNNENSPPESPELMKRTSINTNGRMTDDDFIEDFRKRFPNMPEDAVKNLLSHVRNQLRKKQRDSLMNKTHTDNPLSFDGKDVQDNKNTTKRHTNRKSSRHYANDESLSKLITEASLDADNHINRDYYRDQPDDFNIFETIPRNEDIQEINPFEDFDVSTLDTYHKQCAEESIDLHSSYDNTQRTFATKKKPNVKPTIRRQILRNHNNNHHTRNQNVRNNSLNRIRPKNAGNKIQKYPANSTNRIPSRNKLGKENRIPPLLERPNFRTKPNVHGTTTPSRYISTNRVYDTYSTYSEKKPASKETEYLKKAETIEEQNANIETIYGHSKVVKYGNVDEIEVDNSTPTVTYYIPDSMQYENNGKSMIVTKRIPPEKFW